MSSLDPNNLPSDQELDTYFDGPPIDRSKLLQPQIDKLREYRKKAIVSLLSQNLTGPQFTYVEEFYLTNNGVKLQTMRHPLHGDPIPIRYKLRIIEDDVPDPK